MSWWLLWAWNAATTGVQNVSRAQGASAPLQPGIDQLGYRAGQQPEHAGVQHEAGYAAGQQAVQPGVAQQASYAATKTAAPNVTCP